MHAVFMLVSVDVPDGWLIAAGCSVVVRQAAIDRGLLCVGRKS